MKLGRPIRILLAAALVAGSFAGAALGYEGVGAMGDSLTAGSSASKWPGILQTHRGVDFGGAGLPYNNAVGGATTASLLSQGQHTATAADVAAGDVDVPILWIGGNDLRALAPSIADGSLAGGALTLVLLGGVANIETAMDAVLAPGPDGVLVGAVPPVEVTPQAMGLFGPAELALIAAAVDEANALLLPEIQSRGQPFVDFVALMRDVLSGGGLVVGGVAIDPGNGGGDPHFFFQDGIHPSVTGHAIIANVYLAALNVAFGPARTLLTDLEILTIAGIAGEYTGETFSAAYDLTDYVVLPPPPGGGCAAAAGDAAAGNFTPLAYVLAGGLILFARRGRAA